MVPGGAWGEPILTVWEHQFTAPADAELLGNYIEYLSTARSVWIEWSADTGQPAIKNKETRNA